MKSKEMRQFKYAFWLDDSFSNVIFAKIFLMAQGYDFQILWDMAYGNDNGGSWLVVTDYPGCWKDSIHECHTAAATADPPLEI